jgi:DNA-binding beta-propeller fold protein YncE
MKLSLQVATLTLFSSLPLLHASAQTKPLSLITTQPIIDVQGGDFDHFAVDLQRNRLFVSAEKQQTIEVFNLKTGEHIQTGTDVVKTPHMLAFVPDKNELFVADGGDGSCLVLDGADLHLIKRIPLEAGPDAGIYDPQTRTFYVGNGGRGAKTDFSYLSEISVDQLKEIGRIRVESNNLESMAIDHKTDKLYVNLRDKKKVGIIDLKRKTVVQTWDVPELNLNTPLAYDIKNHRLFIGARKPGKLFILNSENGSVIQTLDIVDTSDDMTYDALHHRIYVSGAEGLNVIVQKDADHYEVVQKLDTLGGKTSEYVPSLKQFYVVHTKSGLAPEAGLQVYKVTN